LNFLYNVLYYICNSKNIKNMKLINSIAFYFFAVVSMIMVLNESSIIYNIIGFAFVIILFMSLKNSSKENIYELIGINWLQKKFNSNSVIMDMTNE